MSRINQQLIAGQFGKQFCMQLPKAYAAKTSCNQLLIDSSTSLLTIYLPICDCLFNSPCCALRYEDDSTTSVTHCGTFLIHVYVHSRTKAVIVEVLDNECVISFCIQCPTHQMLESGQGPYQATLGCREKYSAGMNTPSRYCVHDGPRPRDRHATGLGNHLMMGRLVATA